MAAECASLTSDPIENSMTEASSSSDIGMRLTSPSGLRVELNGNGSLRRIDLDATIVNLFLGNEVEGGPANVYLRRAGTSEFVPLLGPSSPTTFSGDAQSVRGTGLWQGLRYGIELQLAADLAAWFWQVHVANDSAIAQRFELLYAQDVALAPYGTVRMNEYYVSQYVDHTPLTHAERGVVIASRQNLPANGHHPWSAIGSLRKSVSYATDALQFHGLATRAGKAPVGLVNRLSGRRLQHEHSMVVLQDEAIELAPGASASAGFFGVVLAHHAGATEASDLQHVERALALAEPRISVSASEAAVAQSASLFVSAPRLAALDLAVEDERALFGAERRHEEVDSHGKRLSFFTGAQSHVVLCSKELHVERPHGHLLRTGTYATPDEQALTSTVWMNGVFNSMLTQGHVSFNRLLSTTRSYLGLFRSHGQRVFVELHDQWQLLDLPSAFEMQPDRCRWIYRHAEGLIEVRAQAHSHPHEIHLSLKVLVGEPVRFFFSHHIALNGDDGMTRQSANFERRGCDVFIGPAAKTELGERFPGGGFVLAPEAGTVFETVGNDELLFNDRRSRQEPFVCLVTERTTQAGLKITGQLIADSPDLPTKLRANGQPAIDRLLFAPTVSSPVADQLERVADIVPWFTHNAFIHYLSPRGLEQYTGGGWGTRDVTQGPVELLLSAGHTTPIRDLLLRVMRAQNADGDWPQWFMFFERDRAIRAGDSHGDIVFWPVLAVAQYLIASGDASVLDEPVSFFEGEDATVWQHIERALSLIQRRVIQGTALAAYGHGDWNDALQPADPAMREHMCSAWTVTLHHQVLTTLGRALRVIGREQDAPRFDKWAEEVRRDFQRLLIVDGVLTGYALFEGEQVRYLLHPRDAVSGARYSSLAMIHALLEDLFTPEQAREHMRLMDEHLLGPDGIRLFDRPLPYHGGPQRFFQRAESATYFGREIGLMYMHAHLRYAQALARMGEADRFFKSLCQANPIGIRSVIQQATLRQANCYYSSSDAAFEDRYQASAEYERIKLGRVGLDGGWRVYSSGAGIALGLIVRRFLGLNLEADALSIDPVIPTSLNGLRVELDFFGKPLEITYQIKGAGCGVSAVEINGTSVQFAREVNPYRTGAARVSLIEARKLLDTSDGKMKVFVG
jgi:1,2-beta-oligoglucan phosphorylase